jgi:hypothetical protein
MLLFTFAFFVFLIILAIMTRLADSGIDDMEIKKLENVAEGVRKAVVLAEESGTDFQSSIEIPRTLDGVPLGVLLDEDVDIIYVKNNLTNHSVVMSIPDVTGNILPGCNIIKKTGGKVGISQGC